MPYYLGRASTSPRARIELGPPKKSVNISDQVSIFISSMTSFFFATARTIRPSVIFFKVTVPSRRNSISDFFTQKSTISASPAALVSNYSRYLRADQRILEFPCPEKNQNKSQQPSNLDPFRIVISLLTHLRVGNQSLLCESDLLFFFLLLEESKTAPTDR